MKSLNCDQVFDVLTRGPFPTGEAIDRDVERHLCACHECRELAEALRPAIELFHESIDPEESRDLPGYHGALQPTSSGGLAQLVAQAIESETPTTASKVYRPHNRWWSSVAAYRPTQLEAFLGAVAVGAVFVLALAGFQSPGDGMRPQVALASPTPEGLIHLTSLELRPSCFSWTPGRATSALHCCTECHVSKDERSLSKPALAVVAASCRACHP